MKHFDIEFTGKTALLQHSLQGLDEFSKISMDMARITSKKSHKTEADRRELRRLDWFSGLYHDPELGPYIPSANVESCLRDSAKMKRLGKKATQGLFCLTDKIPLEYEGPRDPDAMYQDGSFVDLRGVKVGMARVMRCRPIFNEWKLSFQLSMDDALWSEDILRDVADSAGAYIGLCDYRPKHGRFHVTKMDAVS